jgi:hypothetical protein
VSSLSKPILCLDFDGCVHSYTSGWQGADVISDPPVSGAIEFIEAVLKHFIVVVHSSRFNAHDRRDAAFYKMGHWFREYGVSTRVIATDWDDVKIDRDDVVYLSAVKPPAFLTIDDRALTFTGIWPDPRELLEFRPWNKRAV